MNRRILFVGGHTGGHLFPAEAIARALIDLGGGTPVYLDHGRPLEAKVFNDSGMEKVPAPWAGRGRLRGALSIPAAISLLREQQISAVVGMGAFPIVAPGLAAARLRIPLFLHEQNRVMGRANRWLTPFAAKVFLSFPLTKASRRLRSKMAILGCPVREEFQPHEPAQGPQRWLILGGSQGAEEVNRRMLDAASQISQSVKGRLEIIHQVGEREVDELQDSWSQLGFRVKVLTFIDEIAEKIAESHLVVSRSGGSTIAELMAVGRPGLLFPYPGHKDDHQLENARYFSGGGAGIVVNPQETAQELGQKLEELIESPTRLAEMAQRAQQLGRPRAARSIAEMLLIHLEARQPGRFSEAVTRGEAIHHRVEAS